MRKTIYIRKIDGLELDKEKLVLKPQAYSVLQVLCNSESVLSDVAMSAECLMNLRTYKRWKNHLVMVGLLQVRQLNASSYVISIGDKAIKKDDKMNELKDLKRMARNTFTKEACPILIDSDTFDEYNCKEATAKQIDNYLQDNDIGYYGGTYGS